MGPPGPRLLPTSGGFKAGGQAEGDQRRRPVRRAADQVKLRPLMPDRSRSALETSPTAPAKGSRPAPPPPHAPGPSTAASRQRQTPSRISFCKQLRPAHRAPGLPGPAHTRAAARPAGRPGHRGQAATLYICGNIFRRSRPSEQNSVLSRFPTCHRPTEQLRGSVEASAETCCNHRGPFGRVAGQARLPAFSFAFAVVFGQHCGQSRPVGRSQLGNRRGKLGQRIGPLPDDRVVRLTLVPVRGAFVTVFRFAGASSGASAGRRRRKSFAVTTYV